MTALRPLPHQFVNLQAYPEAHDCPGCDNAAAPCPTYGGADPFYLQLRNEPLPSAPCLRADAGGGEFDPCGVFELNADLTIGGDQWTLTEDWDYSTPGPGIYNKVPYANGAAILKGTTWLASQPGVYRFSFNLHTVTNGRVQLRLGTLSSPYYDLPGTYDWVVYVDALNLINTLRFVSDSGFDGEIISLRIGRAATTWQGVGSGWTLTADGGGWQHLPGFSSPLTFNYPVGFQVYKITTRVDGATDPQAYVDLRHGAQLLRRLYGNGTFTYYHPLYTLAEINYVPSLGWDGAVYLEELAVSTRGHVFGLAQGTANIADLGPGYYEGDFVTLGPVKFDDLRDVYGDPLAPGCYDVAVWDATDPAAVGELLHETEMHDDGSWLVNVSTGSYNWATDPAIPPPYYLEQFQAELLRGNLSQAVPGLALDTCYLVTVNVTPTYDSAGNPLPFTGTFQATLGGAYVGPVETPTQSTQFIYLVNPVAGLGDFSLEFYDATFAVAYCSVRRCGTSVLLSDATFRSSCLAFATTVDCDSAYVEGANPGSYAVPTLTPGLDDWRSPVAYGFQWNRYFKLAQRCPTYLLNPRADGADDRYAYRDGYNCRTSGEVEQVWDLVLGRQGYVSHQALATLAKCPQVRLVRGYDPTTQAGDLYLVTSDDYQPNWAKNARAHAADVSLEVVRLENSRRYLRARF